MQKITTFPCPNEFLMLGRGLLTIEVCLLRSAPTLISFRSCPTNVLEMIHDFNWQKELMSSLRRLYESGRKAIDIPSQFSDLLRLALKGQAKVNVKFLGSEH